ncbi:alpha/beta hydrolase [Lysobacter sp. Hz 25]|uniref:alpha/beta hydrolase n=1 Tax=Lysobacter sp. Hz 25 TaxID=3383698 RepID=UPI0038D4EC0B
MRLSFITAVFLSFLAVCGFFLPGFYDRHVRVDWKSCGSVEYRSWFPDRPAPPRLLCGYVDAPLIYGPYEHRRRPKAIAVKLAITKLPATRKRLGSLLSISGGPGSPGINVYIDDDGPAKVIAAHYDIISYDARGVGNSVPRISCQPREFSFSHETWQLPGDRAKSSDGVELTARKFIDDCIEATGADFLKHAGTHSAVGDVETLRQAIGESHLNIIAYSYGTKVAALYAERYPSKVRAIVLDGVVDLSENDATMLLNQQRGFQKSFERFAAYCAKNSACPLGDDVKTAMLSYQKLLANLDEQPIQAPSGRKLGSDEVRDGLMDALLWPEQWSDVISALAEIKYGRGEKMLLLTVKSEASVDSDALVVINCADTAWNMEARGFGWEHAALIDAASPFDNSEPDDDSICKLWPFPGTDVAHIPVRHKDLPPLLFVAQRHDPTTPHANARKMATFFRSALVTREFDGHTLALSGLDHCVDEAVVAYLLAPLQPRSDTVCKVPE